MTRPRIACVPVRAATVVNSQSCTVAREAGSSMIHASVWPTPGTAKVVTGSPKEVSSATPFWLLTTPPSPAAPHESSAARPSTRPMRVADPAPWSGVRLVTTSAWLCMKKPSQ